MENRDAADLLLRVTGDPGFTLNNDAATADDDDAK
jgi:hypothetical protein